MARSTFKSVTPESIVADVRRARQALWRKGGSTPEGFSRVTRGAASAGKTRVKPSDKPRKRRAA